MAAKRCVDAPEFAAAALFIALEAHLIDVVRTTIKGRGRP